MLVIDTSHCVTPKPASKPTLIGQSFGERLQIFSLSRCQTDLRVENWSSQDQDGLTRLHSSNHIVRIWFLISDTLTSSTEFLQFMIVLHHLGFSTKNFPLPCGTVPDCTACRGLYQMKERPNAHYNVLLHSILPIDFKIKWNTIKARCTDTFLNMTL